MAKKTKKETKKTYERRIEAVITYVETGYAETMTKENVAQALKDTLNCDDIQVKSIKTFEHEK